MLNFKKWKMKKNKEYSWKLNINECLSVSKFNSCWLISPIQSLTAFVGMPVVIDDYTVILHFSFRFIWQFSCISHDKSVFLNENFKLAGSVFVWKSNILYTTLFSWSTVDLSCWLTGDWLEAVTFPVNKKKTLPLAEDLKWRC